MKQQTEAEALAEAARHSTGNRQEIEASRYAGCLSCCAAFNAKDIVDWQDDRSFVFHVGEGARELLVPPETVGRLLRSNALWTEEQPKTVAGDIFDVTPDVAS